MGMNLNWFLNWSYQIHQPHYFCSWLHKQLHYLRLFQVLKWSHIAYIQQGDFHDFLPEIKGQLDKGFINKPELSKRNSAIFLIFCYYIAVRYIKNFSKRGIYISSLLRNIVVKIKLVRQYTISFTKP